MLGITLLLIVTAAFLWGVFRAPARRRHNKAAEAARRAVEHRIAPETRDDSSA
jgi:flagellar biosynthesis/type III secretory pathway M-ring protein FliF/YscJ|tara:strand:+ start:659 stop:817 length:159 start_codon:yes stop_codon:yes gene_type:complete